MTYLARAVTRADDGFMLSYSIPGEDTRSPIIIMDEGARQTRAAHHYRGALIVYLWPVREDENYRLPIPPDADHKLYDARREVTVIARDDLDLTDAGTGHGDYEWHSGH